MSDDQTPTPVGWWGRHAGRLVLLGLLVAALVLWPFSGWDLWAWAFGLAATILVGVTLGAIGARERLGPTWILSAGLAVAAGFLLSQTALVVWGLAAGIVLTLLGILAITGKTGTSRWVWLTALLTGPALLVSCATVLTIGSVQLHQQQERARQQFHELQVAKTLPDPRGGVLLLVEAIGFQRSIDAACFLFTDHARQQFTRGHGAETCAGALRKLHRRVRDADTYVNDAWIPNQATRRLPDGRTTRMDACHLKFGNVLAGYKSGVGPQIGYLTFTQQHGYGSFITNYRPCRSP